MNFDALPNMGLGPQMSSFLSTMRKSMNSVDQSITELRKGYGSSRAIVLSCILALSVSILFAPVTRYHSPGKAFLQESQHRFQVLDLGTRRPHYAHSPPVSLSGEMSSVETKSAQSPSRDRGDSAESRLWELEHAHSRVSELCSRGDVENKEVKMLLLTRPTFSKTSQNTQKLEISSSEAMQNGFFFSCDQAQTVLEEIEDSQPHIVPEKMLIHRNVESNGTSSEKASQAPTTPTQSSKFRFSIILGTLGAVTLIGAALVRMLWSLNSYQLSKASSARKHLGVPHKSEDASKERQKTSPDGASPSPANSSKVSPSMPDEELVHMGVNNSVSLYSWEKLLGDPHRAVKIRRQVVSERNSNSSGSLDKVAMPYMNYDYQRVLGACCENVIGYTPVPTGVAGPLKIDGKSYFVPMATTEGVLVASTNRGCTAINAGSGVTTCVTDDGMTRGPSLRFPSLERASAAKLWLDSKEGWSLIEKAFNSTSRFAMLQSVKSVIVGSDIFIRFKAHTGDAMGMNMISKGVERALNVLAEAGFQDMQTISISGNYCTDKKPSAVNWIDGRGKSVNAQVTIPGDQLKKILKTDVESLVELNTSKNLVGSAVAGSVGGFNAHAANIVTAIFLATGQDPAQNVESSNCLTVMKNVDGDLQISVTMPSIEVGTVGGGTNLEAQGAMLDMLGLKGAHTSEPGKNSQDLARIVAATVLAGELSLCSSLAAGSLVNSHMSYNRNTSSPKK